MAESEIKNVSVVRNHTDRFIRFLIICHIAAKKVVAFRPKISSYPQSIGVIHSASRFCLWYKGWHWESLVSQDFKLEKKDWQLSSTKIFPTLWFHLHQNRLFLQCGLKFHLLTDRCTLNFYFALNTSANKQWRPWSSVLVSHFVAYDLSLQCFPVVMYPFQFFLITNGYNYWTLNNLTEMFIIMPTIKITQTILFCSTKYYQTGRARNKTSNIVEPPVPEVTEYTKMQFHMMMSV